MSNKTRLKQENLDNSTKINYNHCMKPNKHKVICANRNCNQRITIQLALKKLK
jgi:hypothetical protein